MEFIVAGMQIGLKIVSAIVTVLIGVGLFFPLVAAVFNFIERLLTFGERRRSGKHTEAEKNGSEE